MKLYIKNMVCSRCKSVVENELKNLALHPLHVELGEVTLVEDLPPAKIEEINKVLNHHGFQIIDDKRKRIIEQIKNLIINAVHHADQPLEENFSNAIAAKLHHDYSYLSNLFSSVEGITIERYIIMQKIEKVKELLVYDELSLSEVADKIGYSDVAHLSNQFKKITGLTPSAFRKLYPELIEGKRKPIEEI